MLKVLIIPDPENPDLIFSTVELCQELSSQNVDFILLDLSGLLKNTVSLLAEKIIFNKEKITERDFSHLIAIHINRSKKLNKLVKRLKIQNKIGFNLGFRYSPYSLELKKGKIEHIREVYDNILKLINLRRLEVAGKTEPESGRNLLIILDKNSINWPKENWIFFFRNPSIFKYKIRAIFTEESEANDLKETFNSFKTEVLSGQEICVEEEIKNSSMLICFSSKWAFWASYLKKSNIFLTDSKTIVKPINNRCIIIKNRLIQAITFDSLLAAIREINNEV